MADWQKWRKMAIGSQKAAQQLENEEYRSCASRIYYSAYQAMTAILLYSGCIPPVDREGWNHEITPDLIVDQCMPMIKSRESRKDMASRLKTLYKMRIVADYIGNDTIDEVSVKKAMRDGNFLVKVAIDILPGD